MKVNSFIILDPVSLTSLCHILSSCHSSEGFALPTPCLSSSFPQKQYVGVCVCVCVYAYHAHVLCRVFYIYIYIYIYLFMALCSLYEISVAHHFVNP